METLSTSRAHGGVQGVYRHASSATGTQMEFSVFVPDHAEGARLPLVWYLSGLTCSQANVTEKGEFRAASAFAPIVASSQVPWGHKALPGYLGADKVAWAQYDACARSFWKRPARRRASR